jgi:hypothetical protein
MVLPKYYLPTNVPFIGRGARSASPLLAFGAELELDMRR